MRPAIRTSRFVVWWRRAFVAASVLWAGLLLIAPFAASRPQAGPVGFGLAYTAYAIGHVVCHQLPVRSFQLWSVPLPVCARCTGIYVGAAVASVLAAAFGDAATVGVKAQRATATVSSARVALAVAATPTALTLLYEWTTGDVPAHWVRALAGAPLGAAIAWIIREVN